MKCKAEINLFKESGKWYTTEYFEFDDKMTWIEIYDSVKEHYKNRLTDMHLVITNFGAYGNGFPLMIPIGNR